MTITTDARHADLGDLVAILRGQQARKFDIVAPAATIRSVGGIIRIAGAEEIIDLDGVTVTDGSYRPTAIFDGHAADKLGIPIKYLRRMRDERVDLYDANINGWLHGGAVPEDEHGAPGDMNTVGGDERSFLIRAFRDEAEGGIGVARAMLSDRFGIVDNLDFLVATLDGIRQAGVKTEILACDLTENRMHVQVAAPEVAALAPELLRGYRTPAGVAGWTLESARAAAAREGKDYPAGEEPVVFAGFIVGNSETGGGAATITPRIIVRACKNGLQIPLDAMRVIHLGSRLDDGVVKWSRDTQEKNLAVITAKARDAVATFLSPGYLAAKVAEFEKLAGAPVVGAQATIERVGKELAFTEAQMASVLDHFIQGGQMTAGGVLQAVTSVAQGIPDADTAYEFEAKGLRALVLAAR